MWPKMNCKSYAHNNRCLHEENEGALCKDSCCPLFGKEHQIIIEMADQLDDIGRQLAAFIARSDEN